MVRDIVRQVKLNPNEIPVAIPFRKNMEKVRIFGYLFFLCFYHSIRIGGKKKKKKGGKKFLHDNFINISISLSLFLSFFLQIFGRKCTLSSDDGFYIKH